jgi:hypothetical protein
MWNRVLVKQSSYRMQSMRAPAQQAVVLVTHVGGREIHGHFARLRSEVAGLLDTFVCVDASVPGRAFDPELPAHFKAKPQDAARLLPARYLESRSRHGGIIPGYPDLVYWPALLSDRLAAYDYLWILEYDVDYAGNWREFFARTMPSPADLLGTTIFPRAQSEDWVFWEWFRSPPEVTAEFHLRSFLPIARFSRRMLELYTKTVRDDRWGGHTESLFPTIAHFNGLLVEDLGGAGPFCPPAWRSKNYDNTPWDERLSPGTFVFRPVTLDRYYHDSALRFSRPGFLYHPVKYGKVCAPIGAAEPASTAANTVGGHLDPT